MKLYLNPTPAERCQNRRGCHFLLMAFLLGVLGFYAQIAAAIPMCTQPMQPNCVCGPTPCYPDMGFVTFTGYVKDATTGTGLSGALVSINSLLRNQGELDMQVSIAAGLKPGAVQTDSTGYFIFNKVPKSNSYVVNAYSKGYAPSSQRLFIEQSDVQIKLTNAQTRTFDSTKAQSITDDQVIIKFDANALVYDDPTLPLPDSTKMPVTAYIHTYMFDPMPGNQETYNGFLVSNGAFFVEFFDKNGTKLYLKSHADVFMPPAGSFGNIGLWFYNEISGIWQNAGTATLDTGTGKYKTTVNYFYSAFNFGVEQTNQACTVFKIDPSVMTAYGTPFDSPTKVGLSVKVTIRINLRNTDTSC
jgi:hypothetical protein